MERSDSLLGYCFTDNVDQFAFKEERKKKRPRAYYAAASKKSRQKLKDTVEYLSIRNKYLESEKKTLGRTIETLHEEVRILESREASTTAIWRSEIMNEALKLQVAEYRFFSQQIKQFFQGLGHASYSSELELACRNNVSFMFEKLSYLLSLTKNIKPIKIRKDFRKTDDHMKKWISADVRIPQGFKWFENNVTEEIEISTRVYQNGPDERWVRMDCPNIPISRSEYLDIADKLKIFRIVMDTASRVIEDYSEAEQVPHPVRFHSITKEVDVLGDTSRNEFGRKYRPTFTRTESHGQESFFVTATDFASLNKDASMTTECIMPKVTSNLEEADRNKTFFLRGMSVTDGGSKNHSNLSLVFGMKRRTNQILDPNLSPEDREESLDFEKCLQSLGGFRFLSQKFSTEFCSLFFETVLKRVLLTYEQGYSQLKTDDIPPLR